VTDNEEFEEIEPIAIIGASCRFPGADSLDEFWANLCNGNESVSFFTEDELAEEKVSPDIYKSSDYVNAACVIDDIEMFDPVFFGYTEEEAELIDPQQRLFLQCAYEAIEDAGYSVQNYDGITGVFGGTRTSSYAKLLNSILIRVGSLKSFEVILGNTVDQACLRVSYGLNLKGPSIGVQTVCSSSIVAVHLACESLQNGECDLALAGASAINIPQKQGYLYDEGMVLSPDGHCRAFDIKAQGSVPGNGIGVVVLKRFSEAVEDKDHIYAVVKGTAVNNDGASKIGYRAPSIEGQASVINNAVQLAGIDPGTISYIEANGTGTFHGDSVEIEALSRVFQANSDRKSFCGIGAVKTNIGHLTHAAGIAGLIKTILSLKYKKLPPSLNCETLNPQLNNSPFYVVRELSEWKTDYIPRRAGVNAFAIGGSNAHVVLEEAPQFEEPVKKVKGVFHILAISAKTEKALGKLVKKYDFFLKSHPEEEFQDICFTANVGRDHFPCRLALVADSMGDLSRQISDLVKEPKQLTDKKHFSGNNKVLKTAFLFFDHTTEFMTNYRFFYDTQPQFREGIDLCLDILKKNHGLSLFQFVLGDSISVNDTYSATAGFVVEYAFAAMWKSWGIEPSVVTGYGSGFCAAACVAEVIRLEDGLKLVVSKDDYLRNVVEKRDDNHFILFEEVMNNIELSAAKINIISPFTGIVTDIKETLISEFWNEEDKSSIDPEKIKNYLSEKDINYVIEIGNDSLLFSKNIGELLPGNGIAYKNYNQIINNQKYILECLSVLYVSGADINWKAFNNNQFRRVSLPTYPFERKRCWFKG